MGKVGKDLRYAIRSSLRNRSVALLAILAFALGIGITTAVFSIFNSVLLSPLPYPDADQLVMVFDTQPACATCPASFPKYHDWKSRNRVFAAMTGSVPRAAVLTGVGTAEQVQGVMTTASLVDVFRVQPAIGRWFTDAEDQPGAGKVVVLADTFWRSRFNAEPSIVGRPIVFDGEPYEVIGVMPPGFVHRAAAFFVPLARKLDPATRGNHFLVTYARLKKGVPVERAAIEMRALGETLAKEFGHNHGIDVRSYYDVVVGSVRGPLQVLLGAVFCVLVIACVNVANLLLASGLARRREIAVRLALGAGQHDVARQLTIEALLLAIVGGTVGLLLSFWIVRIFVALAADSLPRADTIHIDGRVLAFTAVTSVIVGIVCGLSPLIRMRLRTLTAALREGDMRTASGGGASFGNGLVVAEIAIAFALLVGAGLLVKNLMLLERRDTGIRPDHVIVFDLSLSGPRYRDDGSVSAFYRALYERLAHVGGMQYVGLTSHLPMYRFGNNGEMTREGGNPWGPNENPLVEYRYMYGDYLKALGIPLRRGRVLDSRDGSGSNNVLINQAMADKFWPNEDPIGKRFGQGNVKTYYTVVGVIGSVRSFGLARATPYEFYRTTDQAPFRSMTVVMRSSGPAPSSLIPTARSIVAAIDPNLPVTEVQMMEDVVSASVGQSRLLSALSGLFGALAGLLAMVGVYGVTSYNVRRQRREFGIRLALGADPHAVQRLIVGRGLVVAGIGVGVGIVAALVMTRTLGTMLNDVRPTDPSVFGLSAAAVLVVSILACYIPARWAGRVDPAIVLRDS